MRKFKRRLSAFLLATMLAFTTVATPVTATTVPTEASTEASTEEGTEEQTTEGITEEGTTEGSTEEVSTEITSEETTTPEETTEPTSEEGSSEETSSEEASSEEATDETTTEEATEEEESEIITPEDGGVEIYYDENGEAHVDISDELIEGLLMQYSAAGNTLSDDIDWKRLTYGANDTNRNGKKIYNAIKAKKYDGMTVDEIALSIVKAAEDAGASTASKFRAAYKQSKDTAAAVTCKDNAGDDCEYPVFRYERLADNNVGTFATAHFKDVQGITHGNTHMITKMLEYNQVKMTIYCTKNNTDEDGDNVKEGYYFIIITGEATDEVVADPDFPPILTYCIEYGEGLESGEQNYTATTEVYDILDDEQKYRIAAAAYYGPHYDVTDIRTDMDDDFLKATTSARSSYERLTTSTKMPSSQSLSDPSTWTKDTWARHVASQLYIWTVQTENKSGKEKLSITEAMNTAKKVDNDYGLGTKTYDYFVKTKKYVENCKKVSSFAVSWDYKNSIPEDGATITYYKLKATDGTYKKVFNDSKELINDSNLATKNVEFMVTSSDTSVSQADLTTLQSKLEANWNTSSTGYLKVDTDGSKLTVSIPSSDIPTNLVGKDVKVRIVFQKNDKVPVDDLGAIFLAREGNQNMIEAIIDPYTYYGAFGFKLSTASAETTQIGVHKVIDNEVMADLNLANVKFYVLTDSPYAAIYNPDATSGDDSNMTLSYAEVTALALDTANNEENCLAKAYYYNGKLYPYNETTKSSIGSSGVLLYTLAVQPQGTSGNGDSYNMETKMYTLKTDADGNAMTSEGLLYINDTSGTASNYYLLEYDAPTTVEPVMWNAGDFTTNSWTEFEADPLIFTSAEIQGGYSVKEKGNTAIKGGLAVYKYAWRADGTTDEYLNGIQFALYKDINGTPVYLDETTKTTPVILETGKHLNYADGTTTDITSSHNGWALIDNLEPGTYYVQEVAASAKPLSTPDTTMHELIVTGNQVALDAAYPHHRQLGYFL